RGLRQLRLPRAGCEGSAAQAGPLDREEPVDLPDAEGAEQRLHDRSDRPHEPEVPDGLGEPDLGLTTGYGFLPPAPGRNPVPAPLAGDAVAGALLPGPARLSRRPVAAVRGRPLRIPLHL